MNLFIAICIRQACSYVLYWNHLESIIIYRESIMLWCRMPWESCVMINNVCNISSGLIGCIYCSSKLLKNIGIARSWILCFGTMFITIWFTSCIGGTASSYMIYHGSQATQHDGITEILRTLDWTFLETWINHH